MFYVLNLSSATFDSFDELEYALQFIKGLRWRYTEAFLEKNIVVVNCNNDGVQFTPNQFEKFAETLKSVLGSAPVADKGEEARLSLANDWFFFTDPATVEWVYYSHDADGKGQFIFNYFSAEQFRAAKEKTESELGSLSKTDSDAWCKFFFDSLRNIMHEKREPSFYKRGSSGYAFFADTLKNCNVAETTEDTYKEIGRFFDKIFSGRDVPFFIS